MSDGTWFQSLGIDRIGKEWILQMLTEPDGVEGEELVKSNVKLVLLKNRKKSIFNNATDMN